MKVLVNQYLWAFFLLLSCHLVFAKVDDIKTNDIGSDEDEEKMPMAVVSKCCQMGEVR